MERRSIYDPSLYWRIERNWYRRACIEPKLNRARYERYALEMVWEYEMRSEQSQSPRIFSNDIVAILTYFMFFGAGKREYETVRKKFREYAGINCLDDFSLETLFLFTYSYDHRGNLKDWMLEEAEILERRHSKTGEKLRYICCQREFDEGAILLADILKELMKERKGEDKMFYVFSAHTSSLIDKGIVERSSFDILARHFESITAETKGWSMRPYEGVVPEMVQIEGKKREGNAKELFVDRLENWLYSGRWYSNLSLTSIETILEDIGREEIPPTPMESKKARIEYEKEYEYLKSYKKSKVIYGADAIYMRVLSPGVCIEAEDATNIIVKEREILGNYDKEGSEVKWEE